MKKEILLLVLYFGLLTVGTFAIVNSIAKMFVSNINSVTASYFPENGNAYGIGE